jgi:hypothetical protein
MQVKIKDYLSIAFDPLTKLEIVGCKLGDMTQITQSEFHAQYVCPTILEDLIKHGHNVIAARLATMRRMN